MLRRGRARRPLSAADDRAGGRRRRAIAGASVLALALAAAPSATGAPKVRYPSKAFTVPGAATGGGKVMCGGGRSVLGGGFDGGAGEDELAVLTDSRPVDGRDRDRRPDDGWKVTVDNTEPAPAHGRVYATCARTEATYVRRRSYLRPIWESNVFDATCKRGTVTGGGVSVQSGGVWIIQMSPANVNSSNDGGRVTVEQWTIGLERVEPDDQRKLRVIAYAICVRAKTIPRIADNFNTPDNAETRVIADCPRKSRALGGGAFVPFGPGDDPNGGITELIPGPGGVTGATFAQQGGWAQTTVLCARRLPRP